MHRFSVSSPNPTKAQLTVVTDEEQTTMAIVGGKASTLGYESPQAAIDAWQRTQVKRIQERAELLRRAYVSQSHFFEEN